MPQRRPSRRRKRLPVEAIVLVTLLIAQQAQAQETPSAPPPPTSPTTTTTTTPPAPAPPNGETPEQKLKTGKSLFAYRDCPGTMAAIAELAIPGQLSDEKDQLEVHRMLGICHALTDTPEHKREASREFSSLLSIDPDFQLDPFEVPPSVIDIFEAQKNAMKARLDEIRKARAKEENFDEGGVLVERVTTVRVSPLGVAFVPFGMNLIANGELGWGIAAGVLQGVLLSVNVIGFWGSVVVQAGVKDGFSPDEVNLEAAFWYPMAGTAVGVVVVYVLSAVASLWLREDQLILAEKQTKRPLTAAELKKLKRIERAPDPDTPGPTAPPPP